jgi:hypothetical protein
MEQKVIDAISQEIYRRFPEVKGKKPKVQAQRISNSQANAKTPNNSSRTYLLIYQSQATTSTHKTLPRLVRVVADKQGKILKITTSH